MAVSFIWPFTDVMTQTATNDHPTALVLGATGKTGSRVAQRLSALSYPVRAGSRSGSPPFDWSDRNSWGPALGGAGAVYLCYQPDLGIPGRLDDRALRVLQSELHRDVARAGPPGCVGHARGRQRRTVPGRRRHRRRGERRVDRRPTHRPDLRADRSAPDHLP